MSVEHRIDSARQAVEMDTIELRRARAHAQGTDLPARFGSTAEVVRHMVGLQAQDERAAALAVRARTAGLTEVRQHRRSRAIARSCSDTKSRQARGESIPKVSRRIVSRCLQRRRLSCLGERVFH